MDYKHHFSEKKQSLEQEISNLKSKIAQMPDGILRFYNSNGHQYPFCVYPDKKKRRSYLDKNQQDLVLALALKAFYTARLSDCEAELSATNACINAYESLEPAVEHLMEDSIMRNLLMKKLPEGSIRPNEDELAKWENSSYARNEGYPENLRYTAIDGRKVRSKAEQEIASLLSIHHIHYRYEWALKVQTGVIYPDFTIKHPCTGKLMIWEHFGMTDNPEYYTKMLNKLMLYRQTGYVLGVNLIITYETAEHPLDAKTIQYMINNWLLD